MDDNNETTPIFYVSEVPTVKDQLIASAVGIGVTLVTYGAIVGGAALYSKVQDIRAKKAEQKLALVTDIPTE